MRIRMLLLILGFAATVAGEIQAPGEELPPDLWLASGRDALGLGWRSGGTARLRGEWSGEDWRLLADRSGAERPRLSAAWTAGSFRLSLGSLRREEGLLGQERRRARLASMVSAGSRPSALSLADQGRGGFLDWRSRWRMLRLGWQEELGPLADLGWRAWTLRLRTGAASLRFRRSSEREILEIESATAGRGSRQGFRLRAASGVGVLRWSAEGLVLSGPRPEAWLSRGWIGAESGQEAHLAAAWRRGALSVRVGTRWRRGLGLPDYRRRRELLLALGLRRAGESWRLEIRRLEDRDSQLTGTPAVFPVWEVQDSATWEARLARRGTLSWEAVIRGGGEDSSASLLRLSPPNRLLGHGFRLGGRAVLFHCPASESFRVISGGFLARRSRSLRGRGAAMTLSLSWLKAPFSMRLDADLGAGLAPGASLVLGWEAP